jgi:hypothetical protein
VPSGLIALQLPGRVMNDADAPEASFRGRVAAPGQRSLRRGSAGQSGLLRRDRLAPSLLTPPRRRLHVRWPSVAGAGLRHAALQDTSGALA